jgi:hypothetical protein
VTCRSYFLRNRGCPRTPGERHIKDIERAVTRQRFVRLACNNELMLGRRTLHFVRFILGLGIMLSACTSPNASPVQQGASTRSACSLLTVQEAAKALGGPVDAPAECATSTDSAGLYHLSAGPGTLLVHVSWGKRAVTTFNVAHSGHAKYLGGAAPPQYGKVIVAGLPAYWQLRPTPGPGGFHSLSSLKSGYVVMLTSMDLSQSQVENALAAILNHL